VTWLDWARVWSPVVPVAETNAAWRTLGLPGDPAALHADFLATFHYGVPVPAVPLVLHHTLNRPGDSAREDWMRVLAWLDLAFGDVRLPPDHLAIACEVLAVAQARNERVILHELLERYVRPWCDVARHRLERTGSPLLPVVERFSAMLADADETVRSEGGAVA
jgi:hypothetical protein